MPQGRNHAKLFVSWSDKLIDQVLSTVRLGRAEMLNLYNIVRWDKWVINYWSRWLEGLFLRLTSPTCDDCNAITPWQYIQSWSNPGHGTLGLNSQFHHSPPPPYNVGSVHSKCPPWSNIVWGQAEGQVWGKELLSTSNKGRWWAQQIFKV